MLQLKPNVNVITNNLPGREVLELTAKINKINKFVIVMRLKPRQMKLVLPERSTLLQMYMFTGAASTTLGTAAVGS